MPAFEFLTRAASALTQFVRKGIVGPIQWPMPTTAGGWFPIIHEPFPGAWQRNIAISRESVITQSTVFACMTLISSDISKMRPMLIEEQADEISVEVEKATWSPVLRKPNHFQNYIQFFEHWVLSRLGAGNVYVLIERDRSNDVSALYVLDPYRVKVLVAPNGEVYYELQADALAGRSEAVTVPASEIIHDRIYTFYHPLCGISPLAACYLPALQNLKTQEQSSKFFAGGANLSGVLTTANPIGPDTAERIRKHWEDNFSGENNIGKVAVLGDGLKFEPMQMTFQNAQLAEQLKLTDEQICRAFHVPAYMVGVGDPPNYNNIEALNQQYYSQCLQFHLEGMEVCLDEGLGLGAEFGNPYGVEFDLDTLLRMDSATKMDTVTKGIKGGVYTPNEGRQKMNLPSITGGDTVYLQEQDHSLRWLFERDQNVPAAPPPATPAPAAPPTPPARGLNDEDVLIAAFKAKAMLLGLDRAA